MASQRDVKNRISSVKNIQKITRAMEMVAAARLRRAEQRIAAMRPYGDAVRRVIRQAAAFTSQVIRAGVRLAGELSESQLQSSWYATGRRGVSSLTFRGYELSG